MRGLRAFESFLRAFFLELLGVPYHGSHANESHTIPTKPIPCHTISGSHANETYTISGSHLYRGGSQNAHLGTPPGGAKRPQGCSSQTGATPDPFLGIIASCDDSQNGGVQGKRPPPAGPFLRSIDTSQNGVGGLACQYGCMYGCMYGFLLIPDSRTMLIPGQC